MLELERRLDRIMLLDPEESEQLFNNLAEYRGKLYRDAVTGAYNERYYQEKYRSRILTAGVAVLRVDDFKAANDVYGRYAGNSVLETVAGVLRRNLGEKDRLIRRGEDRLLLLLPEVGQSDFGQKLEHLRLQLAAAGVPGYSHLHISVSIGGVWIRDGEVSAAVEHAERLATYAQMQKNTVITEQQPERTAAAPVHRRQSVLIVDDSELNRKMLGQMLGSRFDIAEAASGEGLPAAAGTERHRHFHRAAGHPYARHRRFYGAGRDEPEKPAGTDPGDHDLQRGHRGRGAAGL